MTWELVGKAVFMVFAEEDLALRAMSFQTHGRSVRPARVLNLFLRGSALEGVSSAGCSVAGVESDCEGSSDIYSPTFSKSSTG